jgi:CHAT domain-containing protein
LNFETLVVPAQGSRQVANSSGIDHYLVDDLTMVSAPSLAMLGAPKLAPDQGSAMLLLGDPVSPSQDFPSLPLFGYEMTRIESHFDKDRLSVVAGPKATPAAYLSSHPSQYSYIHFVSHAIANSTDPLDSAIILSSSAADDSSFKLYARDIIRQPIDAQLVTISACYGSGTRLYAGEGLVGLSWAFLRAGAERVVGALWEVSDISTPRLMDSFYGSIAGGNSPEASLRTAKLTLLHSAGRFSLPFYWAAFQMYDRE